MRINRNIYYMLYLLLFIYYISYKSDKSLVLKKVIQNDHFFNFDLRDFSLTPKYSASLEISFSEGDCVPSSY